LSAANRESAPSSHDKAGAGSACSSMLSTILLTAVAQGC
jgi:hypothetical protein